MKPRVRPGRRFPGRDPTRHLYLQVAERLKAEVVGLPPGTRFYTDRTVCRKFKVSQPIARMALALLVKEGRIVRVVSRGTFVRLPKPARAAHAALTVAVYCLLSVGNPLVAAVTAIEERLRARGCLAAVRDMGMPPRGSARELNAVVEQHADEFDGLIWLHPVTDRLETAPAAVRRQARKLICLNLCFEDDAVLCVLRDDRAAVGALTRRLIERGYRRIGYLGGSEDQLFARWRYGGFADALQAGRRAVEPGIVVPYSTGSQYSDGVAAARTLLRAGDPPDALVCVTDSLAAGVAAALREAGLAVPDDVVVTGFDNRPEYRDIVPSLTTVDPASPEMGRVAAALLLAQLAGTIQPGGRHFVPCRLVLRPPVGEEEGPAAPARRKAKGERGR